jgi:hypoxanthine phosphoribosyltransferase
MRALIPVLEKQGVASIRVTALLEKRTPKSSGFKADFVGFSVPDAFVVGYCLDYEESFRDMMHIGVINKHGIQKFAAPTAAAPDSAAAL